MHRMCRLAVIAAALAAGPAHAQALEPTDPLHLLHAEGATARPATLYRSATGEFLVFARVEPPEPEQVRLAMWRIGGDGAVNAGPVEIPLPAGYDVGRLSSVAPAFAYNAATDEVSIIFLREDGGAPALAQRFSASGDPLAPPTPLGRRHGVVDGVLIPDPSTGGYLLQAGTRAVHLDSRLQPDSRGFKPFRGSRARPNYGFLSYDLSRERFLALWRAGRRVHARTIGARGGRPGKARRVARVGRLDAYLDLEFSPSADAFIALEFDVAGDTETLALRGLTPGARPRPGRTIVFETDVDPSEDFFIREGLSLVPAEGAAQLAVASGRYDLDQIATPGYAGLRRFDAAGTTEVAPLFRVHGRAHHAYGTLPRAYGVGWADDSSGGTDVYFDLLPADRR
jgi:hypothetical protein